MEINIPGPMNPAYFDNIRFSLVNKLERLRDDAKGRDVLVTDVPVVREPRGRPVWNTFVMSTWRGDIVQRTAVVG